jgi:hypothetical protein
MDAGKVSDQELDQMLLGSAERVTPSADSISDSDLDNLLSGQAPAEGPSISKKESAARGVAQGATLGFADEIAGGVESLWEKAKGDPAEFGELYKKHRDESRAAFEQAQKANPASYTAGEVGGAIGSALIPGMAIAKGAGLASAAGRAALIGGTAGAGYSEGESAKDVALDAAGGAVAGGVIGGVAHVVAPHVARGVSSAGKKIKGTAERFAARALGAERGTINKLGQEKIQAAGRQALDEGVISPLASADKMSSRNAAVGEKGGKLMGKVYDAIDEKGASKFNPLDVASKVDDELGGFYRSPINKGEARQLDNTLESIMMRGDKNIPLKEAQVLKQELQKVANWKNNLNVTEKEKMARSAYKIVSQAIDDAAEKGSKEIGAEGLEETLKQGKKLFGNSKTAETLLKNRVAREQGNKFFGLTDNITGVGALGYGATTGDWATAGGIYAAKKGLGKYGSQNAALLLDKAGNILTKAAPRAIEGASKNPNLLDKAGGSAAGKSAAEVFKKVAEEKPKGEKKWAGDGFNKILEHVPNDERADFEAMRESMIKDSKKRKLLIHASELKPGSKAMDKIINQIKSGKKRDVTDMGVE